MRLARLKVHNFRGVLDADVEIKNYALLVGPNNAGKSTLIDAIRCVYEKDLKFDPAKDWPHAKTKDEESWVELDFRLTAEENASLKDEYRLAENELRVRKLFRSGTKADKERDGFLYAYTPDGKLSANKFYGAKNVQDGKIGDLIYVPAVSTVEEHTKLSGPSALRDLLNVVMGDVIASGSAYEVFDEDFQKFTKALSKEEVSGRSLEGVARGLSSMLTDWGAKFELKFKAPDAASIIKTLLDWEFRETTHDRPQRPEQFGSGFQRHFIYSLIQLSASYETKKSPKKTKDFAPTMTLLLFEEPEAFLHPPQQEVLARNLRALGHDQTKDRQVLCATHSAHFVSKQADDIPAIVRVRRDAGVVTAHQVKEAQWQEIADANQQINIIAKKWPKLKSRLDQDDMKPEMEAVKHLLWLNAERCGLFFANIVLCVEGATEAAFLGKLVGEGVVKAGNKGVFFLDCLGKYNIHRFMNLLGALGIDHSVIHDDDSDKDEHAELNQLIQTSRQDRFTQQIVTIKGDLEEMLGIPRTKADHRKPQHLLFLYAQKKVQDNRLNDFVALVHGSLEGTKPQSSPPRPAAA